MKEQNLPKDVKLYLTKDLYDYSLTMAHWMRMTRDETELCLSRNVFTECS